MALRIAFFGQAAFGRDVLLRLLEEGHEIAAVYAPPAGARPDPLAEEAESRGLQLIRHRSMRRKGAPIPERVAEHAALGADLNVLAFVTMILPEAVVESPRHGSLCFHPSLLPKFRGGNALAWQILEGESEAGVTVFQPDAGVDTGPIVVQKGPVPILPHHTSASLYFESLYALGVEAMVEAVGLVDRGEARPKPQDEARASFQGLVDDAVARIDWTRSAQQLDRQIRGCDPNPGARTQLEGRALRLFGGQLAQGDGGGAAPGTVLAVGPEGLELAARGGVIRVAKLRFEGAAKLAAGEAGIAAGQRLG
jgi:methionyl-tRNA formyltransferase